jgi:hypothetical protein
MTLFANVVDIAGARAFVLARLGATGLAGAGETGPGTAEEAGAGEASPGTAGVAEAGASLTLKQQLPAARLAGILDGARPAKAVVKALEALQNADGGFPVRLEPGAPSAIDATCFILNQLQDLPPLPGSPMASRAVSFLRRAQARDGYWTEPEPLREALSPWVQGEGGTGYLTANATFTLLMLDPSHRDPINWGLRWLSRHLENEGTYAQTRFLTWAAAWRHEGPYSTLATKAWEGLKPTLDQLDAGDLAWLLSAALAAGVGGRYLLPIADLVNRLASLQEPDGGWPGDDPSRIETTLQALRVLHGYGWMCTQ